MVELRIEALAVSNLHEFLEFFDHEAFNGSNEKWDGCYCQFYLNSAERNEAIKANPVTKAAINRSDACTRVETGKMQGYLAFDGDQVVGWNLAGESLLFPEVPDANETLARMLCFVIHPKRRGEGIASAMLAHAVEDLRIRGFAAIEAAPYRATENFELNYRGTVSMFEKAGFEQVADLGDFGLLMRLEF